MQTTTLRSWRFWATPATALVIGFGYLAASWVGGDPAGGVIYLAISVVAAVGSVVFAHGSETLRGLMDHRDERLTNIDVTASAYAGLTVLVAVLGALLVDLARGGDGMPYAWLGAVGGVGYIVAVVVLRIRG